MPSYTDVISVVELPTPDDHYAILTPTPVRLDWGVTAPCVDEYYIIYFFLYGASAWSVENGIPRGRASFIVIAACTFSLLCLSCSLEALIVRLHLREGVGDGVRFVIPPGAIR